MIPGSKAAAPGMRNALVEIDALAERLALVERAMQGEGEAPLVLRPTIRLAAIVVAQLMQVDLESIMKPGRAGSRGGSRARMIAYWLAYKVTGRSMKDIAAAFGKMDHTTISHGIAEIASTRESDAGLRFHTDEMVALFTGRRL